MEKTSTSYCQPEEICRQHREFSGDRSELSTANRTICGIGIMNMIRMGKVVGVAKGDIVCQMEFVNEIFGVAA